MKIDKTEFILLSLNLVAMVVVSTMLYTKHLYSKVDVQPIQHTLSEPMPKIVYVNNRVWHLLYDTPEEMTKMESKGATGYTDCEKLYIHVVTGQDPAYERYTVHHELTHAGACILSGPDSGAYDNMFYNSRDNSSHSGIYRFSTLWADISWNNPNLMLYLGGK